MDALVLLLLIRAKVILMTFFAFCIVCLGFALLLFYQYGSNKVLVTCECLMTASIISPDTTTCCLGQGPPAKLLSKMKMMVVMVTVVVIGPAKVSSNTRSEDYDFDNFYQMKEH